MNNAPELPVFHAPVNLDGRSQPSVSGLWCAKGAGCIGIHGVIEVGGGGW